MNIHDLLTRASDAPPPPRWDLPDVLAAGRRRQRRQRIGGACLAVLAISATSYAALEMVPDRLSTDTPPVLATPSPAPSTDRGLVAAGILEGPEQERIGRRVGTTIVGHLDPDARHLTTGFGGTADRFRPDKKLRSMQLEASWRDGERRGFVKIVLGPVPPSQRPIISDCRQELGSPADIRISTCSEPATLRDGTVVVVGHGGRAGHQGVMVAARHPSGFTAWIYFATVEGSYFLNPGNPNLDPPLTELPVSTDRLTALVTDPRLRWSIN